MGLLMFIGVAVVAVVITAVVACLVLFYGFPHYMINLGFALQRYRLGLKQKYLYKGKSVICYIEKNSLRDDKTSWVFLHGFTASSVQWLDVFKYLDKDLHILAIDLPGHGRSSAPNVDELCVEFMTSTICYFLDQVGLQDKKVHLIGTSLGGALAGIFAAHHPERIEKICMICPAMATPVETEFTLELQKMNDMHPDDVTHHHCRLLPQDVPSLRQMMKHCTYIEANLNFHNQIFQGVLNLRLQKNDFFLALLKYMNTQEKLELLPKLAPSITMPSQIIWGKYDDMISSSGAEKLKLLLPDCRSVEILDRCGHTVSLDRPRALAKVLSSFINNTKKDD